ncbi:UNVERIFIED_CONTAM: putative protein phosphatase 2C 63 [Sesamum angustifolium]|uniref:protein-serine/threonine phosphatase n=1 Tax=Sesamum angustifolium TaxID=2727405 RepID=A0AAW2QDE2_9LAMI
MLRSCCFRCFGRRNGDGLLWHMDLKPHASGDFSIAVVQANSSLEDQSQVFTSPSATYVGVYDGHGGPEASRFVNRHLFPYLHKRRLWDLYYDENLLEQNLIFQRARLSPDVIKKAFNATEEDFTRLVKRSMPVKPQIVSVGSCCLLGAISDGELYVANLGDSRAVLGRRGFDGEKSLVAERLSTDHNVSCESVRKEVEALHPDDSHVVVYCRGVWNQGNNSESSLVNFMSLSFISLAVLSVCVSRSIGDVYLKKPEFHRDPVFQQYGNFVPMKRPVLTAEPSIGIAKRLVAAALQEAAKKREVRYKDIKKIERGIRRHFHDDITVVVIYLDHHKSSSKPNHKQSTAGCITPPVDIFSYNSDEAVENSGDKIFPNEESRSRVAY